mmetsp:Transcript_28071/g.51104  ORF Transcript_28071/g.51104 Transcript_28071/m.51104 type:complete len:82 (+) Transcript_28071:103-348(+)
MRRSQIAPKHSLYAGFALLLELRANEYSSPPAALLSQPIQPIVVSCAPNPTTPTIVERTPLADPQTDVARGELAEVHQKVA